MIGSQLCSAPAPWGSARTDRTRSRRREVVETVVLGVICQCAVASRGVSPARADAVIVEAGLAIHSRSFASIGTTLKERRSGPRMDASVKVFTLQAPRVGNPSLSSCLVRSWVAMGAVAPTPFRLRTGSPCSCKCALSTFCVARRSHSAPFRCHFFFRLGASFSLGNARVLRALRCAQASPGIARCMSSPATW